MRQPWKWEPYKAQGILDCARVSLRGLTVDIYPTIVGTDVFSGRMSKDSKEGKAQLKAINNGKYGFTWRVGLRIPGLYCSDEGVFVDGRLDTGSLSKAKKLAKEKIKAFWKAALQG